MGEEAGIRAAASFLGLEWQSAKQGERGRITELLIYAVALILHDLVHVVHQLHRLPRKVGEENHLQISTQAQLGDRLKGVCRVVHF
jgi:hypothetical protein